MRNAYGEVTYATAAEVSRNFGRWQDQALAGPVVITHHGRPRVVVVSAQQYDLMASADGEPSDGESVASQLQEVLAALQAFQSALAGSGTIRLNRRGIVTAIDEPVARRIGMALEDILGAPMTELVRPSDRRKLTNAIETCFESGSAAQLILELAGDTGSAVVASLGMAPLLKNGSVDGIVVAVTRAASGNAVGIW